MNKHGGYQVDGEGELQQETGKSTFYKHQCSGSFSVMQENTASLTKMPQVKH
jgi:hypothetical protein